MRPPMHHPFSPMTGVGPFGMARTTELTVDPLGNVARQEGTSQLPFLLGNLSHLMIEPLPETAEQSWTVAHGTGVVIKEGGPPRFGPFANDEGFVPAREKTVYTIESATDKQVVIRKQYEFRAKATGDDKPPFEITGEGKYTFNKAEGVSGGLDFKMRVTVSKGELRAEIPVKASYHLVDEAEKAAMAKAEKEAEAEAKRPLAGKEATDVLADLKSGDQMRTIRASQQLATKTPEKPDPEIAKALMEVVLGPQNTAVKAAAARALEKWSTPAEVPGLIKALGDSFPMIPTSAIKALTRHKAPEAIEPVAAKLKDLSTRHAAAEFLKAAGPAAEPAVVKLLENLDPWVRREAASILKVIGTKDSIPALEKATDDPDVFAKNNAKEALAAVKARQ
jgi:HEAT repeat protein